MSDQNNRLQYPRLGVNISAGTTLANQGTVLLANSNGISFGMQASAGSLVVTASLATAAIQSISAGTTRIMSGQAVFSNSNGFSFGVDGQTITAKLPQLSYWDNRRWDATANVQLPQATQLVFQRVSFELPIEATRIDLINSLATVFWTSLALGTWSISAGEYMIAIGNKSSLSVGIYGLSASTLSLLSSTSITKGYSTLLGLNLPAGVFGIAQVGDMARSDYFQAGNYSGGVPGAMPTTVQLSEIEQTVNTTVAAGLAIPYFQLAGTF